MLCNTFSVSSHVLASLNFVQDQKFLATERYKMIWVFHPKTTCPQCFGKIYSAYFFPFYFGWLRFWLSSLSRLASVQISGTTEVLTDVRERWDCVFLSCLSKCTLTHPHTSPIYLLAELFFSQVAKPPVATAVVGSYPGRRWKRSSTAL